MGRTPDGEPAPAGGDLPAHALDAVGERGFGVYVHVPFCVTRCGYCDFNTYTATELPGAAREAYADLAIAELDLARRVVGDVDIPVDTVFFGGGTPTVLPPDDLVRVLSAVRDRFGLAPDAEVTTEANPESTDRATFDRLRHGGFTRVSLGMQSARDHVLAGLDRRHTPGRVERAVADARSAGFEQLSVDLIYGAPGETDDDWQASLAAAVDLGVDHVSAYSLIVEEGTRLAARVRRGELHETPDDVLADRYLMAEQALSGAGMQWYEVSNWARGDSARCRHNLGYWAGGDWWGIGPGAHSHVGGVRWWNVKHPSAYADRLASGRSPALSREVLDDPARRLEDVMLRLRLRSGLELTRLGERGHKAAELARDDGLLDAERFADGVAVLTLRGRLLADAVVRDLVDD